MPSRLDHDGRTPPHPKIDRAETGFTQLGRLGLVSWQRHVAAIATILFFWVGLGTAATLAVVLFAPGGFDLATPSPTSYIAADVSLLCLLAGVAVAVRFVHKRPLRTLVTPHPSIDLGRVGVSFGLVFALVAASTGIEAALNPEDYQLSFDPLRWLAMLPVIVVMTFLQTGAEELLFRSYLMQALGLVARRKWLLIGISALVFAAAHLANPEMWRSPVVLFAFYLCFGVFLSLITLRDNRLELALGAHAANNMFIALVVNHEPSSLPIQAIFQVRDIHPVFSLVSFLIGAVLFSWLLLKRPRAPHLTTASRTRGA